MTTEKYLPSARNLLQIPDKEPSWAITDQDPILGGGEPRMRPNANDRDVGKCQLCFKPGIHFQGQSLPHKVTFY